MPLERKNVVYPCLVFMDVTIKSAEKAAAGASGEVADALKKFADAMRGERKGMEDIFFAAMSETYDNMPKPIDPITGVVDAGPIDTKQ